MTVIFHIPRIQSHFAINALCTLYKILIFRWKRNAFQLLVHVIVVQVLLIQMVISQFPQKFGEPSSGWVRAGGDSVGTKWENQIGD